jgi:hypothetical protein
MNRIVVTTGIHRISPAHYARLVGEEWISRWWWLPLLPVACCAIYGALFNILWVAVAMILFFIILPMLQLWFFYAHSLTPEAAAAVRLHRVYVFADGSIEISFVPDMDTGRYYAPIFVPHHQIKSAEFRAKELVLRLCGRSIRLIIVPITEDYVTPLLDVYTKFIA